MICSLEEDEKFKKGIMLTKYQHKLMWHDVIEAMRLIMNDALDFLCLSLVKSLFLSKPGFSVLKKTLSLSYSCMDIVQVRRNCLQQ